MKTKWQGAAITRYFKNTAYSGYEINVKLHFFSIEFVAPASVLAHQTSCNRRRYMQNCHIGNYFIVKTNIEFIVQHDFDIAANKVQFLVM